MVSLLTFRFSDRVMLLSAASASLLVMFPFANSALGRSPLTSFQGRYHVNLVAVIWRI